MGARIPFVVPERQGKAPPPAPGGLKCRAQKETAVPKATKTSRGGSKRGKFKPGKTTMGKGKRNMTRFSTRKDKKRD